MVLLNAKYLSLHGSGGTKIIHNLLFAFVVLLQLRKSTYPGTEPAGDLNFGGSLGSVTGGESGTTVSAVSGGLCGGCLGGFTGDTDSSTEHKYKKKMFIQTTRNSN